MIYSQIKDFKQSFIYCKKKRFYNPVFHIDKASHGYILLP